LKEEYAVRKKVMAVVLAVLAFSLIAASAATLGGITNSDLGADTTVVAACNDGTGVAVDWGTPSYLGAPDHEYVVTEFHVTGLTGCDGQNIDVTLSNGAGTSTKTLSGTVAGAAADWDALAFGTPFSAEELRRIAIVVYP